MKKLLALIIVQSSLLYLIFHKTNSEEAPKEVQQTIVKRPSRVSLKESKFIFPKSTVRKGIFPEICQNSLVDLSAMRMEEYQEVLQSKKSAQAFFGDECFKKLSEDPTFKNLLQTANCSTFKEKTCLTMFFILKAYFIADQTEGRGPHEMTSEELAANVVKMFFSLDQLNKENFQENLKVLKTFYGMHSSDPDVIEASLGYLMIGKEITKDTSVTSLIDEILEKSSGEFRFDRLIVMKDMLENNLTAAGKHLEKLNDRYPAEPDLAYYQASYQWKLGNRELAESYLEKAIELGKNCVSCTRDLYAETRRKLETAKVKDDKLFSVSIGLNFENL